MREPKCPKCGGSVSLHLLYYWSDYHKRLDCSATTKCSNCGIRVSGHHEPTKEEREDFDRYVKFFNACAKNFS